MGQGQKGHGKTSQQAAGLQRFKLVLVLSCHQALIFAKTHASLQLRVMASQLVRGHVHELPLCIQRMKQI